MTDRQILHRIRRASSPDEIEKLLDEGRQFQNATERTRSRWRKHAEKRRKALEETLP